MPIAASLAAYARTFEDHLVRFSMAKGRIVKREQQAVDRQQPLVHAARKWTQRYPVSYLMLTELNSS